MPNIDNLFLTDARRAVLKGEYDGRDSNERTHRSNIRHRSQLALNELIEVAQSPHIDNQETLPPEQVGKLLRTLYTPLVETEGYEEYRKELVYHIRQILVTEMRQNLEKERKNNDES